MIKIDDIYRATRGGLDVILHYYPQAAEVAGTKNKFRCRGSERTPSAVLLEQTRPDGMTVWKVCDFGDEGHALSPLDICMKEEGITRTYEAVLRLAQIFDVRDELNRSVNKPDIRQRPATVDEKDGTRIFALLPEIPAEHLEVLGPRVTREHAEALHWYEAEYVGYVKNRTVTLKYSTPHYPILMRECLVSPATGDKPEVKFYKIYEPLNPDKGFRFSYTPDGVKPKDYINGLEELKKKYRTWNADREAQHRSDPAKENKPFEEEKLNEAFICSGERDALCCKSLGYVPIWFNSETYSLSEREYKDIMKYVKVLYNIPDIDATGRRKGRELALRYIDIHTVWLPDWLRDKRDNRGKPCKDLRDWMQWRREIKDFRALMDLAMPVRFWTERENKNTQAKEYSIDAACLHYFLEMNGFYTLRDENTAAANYIRVDGNVVRREKQAIRDFVCGIDNADKVWISGYYVDPDGREQRDVRVVAIDRKQEGGDWGDDINISANTMCYGFNVHPNLVGAVPGKSQTNNSGSDKRELFTMKQAMEKSFHDLLLEPLRVVCEYNGWDDAEPCVPMIQLTTLDKHADARRVDMKGGQLEEN